MSYATIAKVEGEFKNVTFTSKDAVLPLLPTAVTIEDVTQWLADADAEINSRLSVKYQTPITGTEALTVMCMLAIWLVKDRILGVMEVKGVTPATSQIAPKSNRQKALDALNDLVSGKMKLTDATPATTADGVRSYMSDNVIQNVFDRTIEQW